MKIQEMKIEVNNEIEILKKTQTEMKTSKWISSSTEVTMYKREYWCLKTKIEELDHSIKCYDTFKKKHQQNIQDPWHNKITKIKELSTKKRRGGGEWGRRGRKNDDLLFQVKGIEHVFNKIM